MLIKVFNVIINIDKIQYLYPDDGDVTASFGKGEWCTISNKTIDEVAEEIARQIRESNNNTTGG